ncbi:MOSC domain-containing protein, partial [Actinotalea sp.]|uniref:MOSC domain-containing protein n=1 Tax=Actinotalea sp. TaxID=1872145 RepID=UPI003569962B
PGLFGENLRVRGPVDDAEIGERWRVGDLLEVEVTGPRTPCATFARWLGQKGWVARYARRARPGVYLRVVVPGPVESGAEVTVLDRPGHGVSVARWFAEQDPADARTLLEAHAAGRLSLAPYLLPYVERAARRGEVGPTGGAVGADGDTE